MNISIYTDGSYKKKGRDVLCGYGIYFPNREYKNISRPFTHSPITNNRAELYAILKSIIIGNIIHKTKQVNSITIHTDSEYAVKTINIWYKKWIAEGRDDYMNKDIIDDIMENKRLSPFITNLVHVRSHTGKNDAHSINNDKADKLAKQGAERKERD
jgi:ribonuclease HI